MRRRARDPVNRAVGIANDIVRHILIVDGPAVRKRLLIAIELTKPVSLKRAKSGLSNLTHNPQ